MSNKNQREPPLEVARGWMRSEDGVVFVTRRSRGFLSEVSVSDNEGKKWRPLTRPEAKSALAELASKLRNHLDAKNLPTDKWPVIPVELEQGYVPEEHGVVDDQDIWIGCFEGYAEPLTEDRIVADLLHTTNRLLSTFSEDHLREIFHAMKAYHLYCTVGEVNELALEGKDSVDRLRKGPRARKARSQNDRLLILGVARDFWQKNPRLKGQPINTTKKIAEAVNIARAAQRPGCNRLSDKTIADHLRLALRQEEAA
jgi:hypothetical protein